MTGQSSVEAFKTLRLKIAEVKQVIVDTQAIRRKLIESLQELYNIVKRWAAEDEDAARTAAYIAQTINNIAKAYDEREVDNILEEAKKLLETLKAKQRGEGV
ncbi:hypothetical protein KEJ37_06715 [Candidatus Bathyarchaeota archaeon]|nr:hypothetical protein [Candidatus Bathyarchaeota archaeon]